MPAVSQAQYNLMKMVAAGKKRVRGLSLEEAAEFVRKTKNPESLPRRKTKKRAR